MRSNISAQRAIDGFHETKDLSVALFLLVSAQNDVYKYISVELLQILKKKDDTTLWLATVIWPEDETHAVN